MRFTTRDQLRWTLIAALALTVILQRLELNRKDDVIQDERWKAFQWMKLAEKIRTAADQSKGNKDAE